MPYIPTFTTQAVDGIGTATDITAYVMAWTFDNGINAITNKEGLNRTRSRGEVRLDNSAQNFNDSVLSAFETINILWGMTTVLTADVKDFEIHHIGETARIFLQSIAARIYDNQVVLELDGSTSVADVLTTAGVSINNASNWNPYTFPAGIVYDQTLEQFMNDFEVYTDSMLFETNLGALGAIVRATENRASVVRVAPSAHYIQDAGSLTQLRRRFRRDAQRITTTEAFASSTEDISFAAGTAVSSLPDWRASKASGEHAGEPKFNCGFDPRDLLDAALIPHFSHYTLLTGSLRLREGPSGGFPFSVQKFRASGHAIQFQVQWSGVDSSQYPSSAGGLTASATLIDTERYRAHIIPDTDFEDIVVYANDDLSVDYGFLPSPAFNHAVNDLALVEERVIYAQTFAPQVYRLIMPMEQRTMARFEDLLNLNVGDLCDVDVSGQRIDVSSQSWVMAKRWRWVGLGVSTIEFDFMQRTELARPRVRYNMRHVIYNHRDVHYGASAFVPPPVNPTAPVWNSAGGADQTFVENQMITPFTVPAVDTANPVPMYMASGLPNGLIFDLTTRQIYGTPLSVGTGTITITATNSEGSDTYTYGYATVAGPAPYWAATSGGNFTWTRDLPIMEITVPVVNSGTPAPTYAASNLPTGITFNATTRVLSGTPSALGTGTITITAANTHGSDTLDYSYGVFDFTAIFETGFYVAELAPSEGGLVWVPRRSNRLTSSDSNYDWNFTYAGINYVFDFPAWRRTSDGSDFYDMQFHLDIDHAARMSLISAWSGVNSVYIWWADAVYEFPFSDAESGTQFPGGRIRWTADIYRAPSGVGSNDDPLGFIIAPSGLTLSRADFGALPPL